MAKRTHDEQSRKKQNRKPGHSRLGLDLDRPRPALLHLAQQLRQDALRSGDRVDAEVADIVSAAWLHDGSLEMRPGAMRLVLAARAYLRTITNETYSFGRVKPGPLPVAPIDDLRSFAGKRLEILAPVPEDDAKRLILAKGMIEYAKAVLLWIATDADEATATLRRLLRDERPDDEIKLTRQTLDALGLTSREINDLENSSRQKRGRATKSRLVKAKRSDSPGGVTK